MSGRVVSSGAPTLRLDDVGLDLGRRTVLSGIDLVVESGVPVALSGPSGSGKTVLCLVLAGTQAPTRGRVEFDGRPLSETRSRVGHILQHHGLVSHLTVEENVALPLQARRMPRSAIDEHVHDAVAAVGLAEHSRRVVAGLSGGERQRVGVARALAGDPVLLVADEPTAELDPHNRTRVLDLLLDRAEAGCLLVVASDDPEVLTRFPRVVPLHGGRMV